MNFVQAAQSGFRNYMNFNGRACRSEFWFWMLFGSLISLIASIGVDLVAGGPIPVNWLPLLVAMALWLPTLAVIARRLHDIEKSGWFQLICLVPIIGLILLIYWGCRRGTSGDNRFGPDPLRPGSPALAAAG